MRNHGPIILKALAPALMWVNSRPLCLDRTAYECMHGFQTANFCEDTRKRAPPAVETNRRREAVAAVAPSADRDRLYRSFPETYLFPPAWRGTLRRDRSEPGLQTAAFVHGTNRTARRPGSQRRYRFGSQTRTQSPSLPWGGRTGALPAASALSSPRALSLPVTGSKYAARNTDPAGSPLTRMVALTGT